MVKITYFFGLENLIHYHADISPKEAFFIQTLFFSEGRGGEGEEGSRLSSVRQFSLCVLLSTWAELFEGRLTRPGFCFLLFRSIFRDNSLYSF